MSKQFLQKLLREEITELNKLSQDFSRVIEEFQIVISTSRVKSEIYSFIPDIEKTKELDVLVTKHAKDICEDFYNYYKKIAVGSKYNFTALIVTGGTTFRLSKQYTPNLKKLEKDLQEYLSNEPLEAKRFHQFTARNFTKSVKTRVFPIEVSITKTSTKDQTIFSTDIYTRSSEKRKEYQELLRKAFLRLNRRQNVATWKGSDSREDIEKKNIIAAFEDNIKPGRNVKKTKTNTKTTRGTTTVSETIKPKVVKRARDHLIKDLKIKKRRTSSKSSISLKALLNKKLPEMLLENMKFPRLVYRTGRFAHSVRVLDVTTTAKGYPYVTYTYMKYPYQTFEPGWAQGSVNRDPRSLIDKSIRDIAAEILSGRLYTRRL